MTPPTPDELRILARHASDRPHIERRAHPTERKSFYELWMERECARLQSLQLENGESNAL